MVKDKFQRVQNIIKDLHRGEHIDEMTTKWLSQTPNQPGIPVFYTLFFLRLLHLSIVFYIFCTHTLPSKQNRFNFKEFFLITIVNGNVWAILMQAVFVVTLWV